MLDVDDSSWISAGLHRSLAPRRVSSWCTPDGGTACRARTDGRRRCGSRFRRRWSPSSPSSAAALSRARILIVVLGLASVVHPLLPLVLAPLALAVRTWPTRQTLVGPPIGGRGIWAAGFWLTPPASTHAAADRADGRPVAVWATTIGLAGGVLLVLDLLFSHASRRSQLAAALLLVIAAAVLVSGRATDVPAFLGASAAALWWRVAAGASQVVAWQTTVAGRVGASAGRARAGAGCGPGDAVGRGPQRSGDRRRLERARKRQAVPRPS